MDAVFDYDVHESPHSDIQPVVNRDIELVLVLSPSGVGSSGSLNTIRE
jgi:hypothetical protein